MLQDHYNVLIKKEKSLSEFLLTELPLSIPIYSPELASFLFDIISENGIVLLCCSIRKLHHRLVQEMFALHYLGNFIRQWLISMLAGKSFLSLFIQTHVN